jgi:hypothetical protein
MDGLDLSQIKPLTEEEAEVYFNQPTIADKYREAMDFLSKTYEHQHEAIERYVARLKEQLRDQADAIHGYEERLNG